MTFSATTGKVSYDGDGATTAFPTVFKFVLKAHVKAILRDAGDLETLWAEGTDYTLTGAGNAAGGTLTATLAPALGERLVLLLDVPFTQEKSLPLGGAFPSTQVEEALDLGAQGSAKLAEVDRRTLKVPESDNITGADLDLPIDSARAGKFLAFDQNGKPTPAAGTTGGLAPVSAYMDTLLPSADAATARATLDAQRDLVTAGLITARGDLIVGNAAGVPSRLPKGAANRFLAADANDIGFFGGTLAKSVNYTVLAADHGKLILVDATAGPVTITLPAVATAGDGFWVAVKKIDSSAEAVTVDGDGAETIDGVATRTLTKQYEAEIYRGDASAWHVVGADRKPGLVLLSSATANNSASIDFIGLITPEFDHYVIECINVRPATDGAVLWLRVSDDNGATFKAGATDYQTGAGAFVTGAQMTLSGSMSNVAGNFLNTVCDLWRPSANAKTHISGYISHINTAATASVATVNWGRHNTAAVVDAVRLLMSTGNIAEGQFNFYGVTKP